MWQIRVGREIGSEALVADGLHARADGLMSLAVLVAVAGSWLGYPIVDPIVGLLIGIAVLFIARDAIKRIWYRLMDAVDPDILTKAESVARKQEGIFELRRIRMRWIGHRLHAEVAIAVLPELSIVDGHQIAEKVRHDLFHASLEDLPAFLVTVAQPMNPGCRRRDAFRQQSLAEQCVDESALSGVELTDNDQQKELVQLTNGLLERCQIFTTRSAAEQRALQLPERRPLTGQESRLMISENTLHSSSPSCISATCFRRAPI